MSQPLNEYATAVANAQGSATARVGPRRAFEQWHITGAIVANNGVIAEPKCEVFKGGIGPAFRVGGTYSGRLSNATGLEIVNSGQDLFAVWTGADPGSTCTITLTGEVRHG